MIDGLELTTMPFIILSVYVLVWILKNTILKTDELRKSLPPIAAILGGCIGVGLFLFIPSATVFENVVDAATTGMSSGLAAVGCNQVWKQFQKYKNVGSDSEAV